MNVQVNEKNKLLTCVESYKWNGNSIFMYGVKHTHKRVDENSASYIDINSEWEDYCSESEGLEIMSGINKEKNWYISGDYENFWGPLECNLVKWWLENNPEYKLEDIE